MYFLSIKVVSLDAFGTLIFPRIPVGTCYAQFAREACGLSLPDKLVEENFFKVYRQMSLKYPNFGTYNNMTSRKWWNKLISKSVGLCLNRNNYNIDEKHTDQLYDWYSRSEAWDIYPNTFTCLDNLKKNNIKIAALSNFDERLPKIFDELDLNFYFEKVIFSSSLPYWKPDPRIFNYLCKLFSITPDGLLHCGDNYEKDYKAAIDFGAQAALIVTASDTATKFRESLANKVICQSHIIHSLDELSRNIFKINKA